ncbi:MAG: Zeta toxin [Syntrophorhabdaceae bacterium PtaU1.Bin034]|jgi:predicted ABC-type ATPase|nr:MAG: Zeta toxin [Syntrophorhabdaceae bacterium PtaU1.Bin034]
MEKGITTKKPTVCVLGGPNGSGKTTFFTKWLSKKFPSIEFVNADVIALELSQKSPEKVPIAAGKQVLRRLEELKNERIDFAFEATLTANWHFKYLRELKGNGFRIILFFLWLRTEDLAVQRVVERHQKGGHFVPERDVRRRYLKSIYNMHNLYRRIADDWFIYDNSEEELSQLVASFEGGRFEIKNRRLYDGILKEVKAYEKSL